MKLSEELVARGFVGQFSAETLAEIVDGESRVVYHGIDPTADSAHVGNFVVWMLLGHLLRHGHTVMFLVGGGTGMIGDPKPDKERQLASSEEVKERVQKIKQQAERILGGQDIEFVNNANWLQQLELITFLRDIGKHFTVNELVKKDAIATRLDSETGLSYTEFAYPLLQAYDYLTLYREKSCTLQVGGSDQWGNIIAGVDLVRRVERATVHSLTVPLVIDKATGKKFGKSEGNAVWLDATKTSPFVFYQFWFNVSDESVIDYLRLFTFRPLAEIDQIKSEHELNPAARLAQKALASAVTAYVHSAEAARTAERVSDSLFGAIPLASLTPEEVEVLKANAPLCKIKSETPLVDVLVQTGLASSKREAREFVDAGAILVAGEKPASKDALVVGDTGKVILVKRGKRHVSLVEIE